MEIKLWLRQPLEQVPPVVSVTGTPAPSGTRATCDTDFTILAARGGKVEIRLSEDLVQELADGLDAHLSDGLVTADVERAAATLNTYANKTMTLTLERSTEGIIFSHHMQLATLICQGASNASRINLSDVRFVHARGSGMIDPKEAKKWVHSAKRLTELAFVSPEDVYGIVYERRIPPTSPLDLMDPFPFHFSTQAGIPDLVCTGKVNGITRNLFIVEVKASSVMGDKAFDDLDNLLQEGGGRATLRLVTVEETGFQVFSELRRDLTDVITQLHTELIMCKTTLGLLTNSRRSVVLEWDGRSLCLTRSISHTGSFPLHRLLMATAVRGMRRRARLAAEIGPLM